MDCENWFKTVPVSEFTGVTVEHVYQAWQAATTQERERYSKLQELVRAHVEASNNDDTAGDTFAALVEAIRSGE